MNEKYMKVLMSYGKDLESIRKLYQKFKQEPPIPRNLPPVSGRIAWSRQLYRKIEHPMRVFKKKPELLKVLWWAILILHIWFMYTYFTYLIHV